MRPLINACLIALLFASPAAAETLKVGFAKYGTLTDIWLASRDGAFKQHGLDVDLVELNDTIQAITALQSKSIDIASAAPGTAMAAQERGFDIVVLGQHETAGTTPPASNTIVVASELPITTIAQLRGKRLAISSPRGQTYACLKELFQRNGMTMEDVQLIEVPFSAAPDLLRSHQADAAVTLDPYATQMVKSGTGRVISNFAMEALPDQPNGTWWTTRAWLQTHKPAAIAFLAAMSETLDRLNADPAAAKQAVADYTGLPPDLVRDMSTIHWNARIDPAIWQSLIDLMVRQGELTRPHQAAEYLSQIP
jgi:ABC-type nitrate/sulfonate/bicarbonate transport system substrate-binding protein